MSLWTPCVEVSCSYGSLCRAHAWLVTVHGGRCGPSTCSSALLWEFECVLIMVFTVTERLSPTPLRQLGLTRNRGGDGLTEAELVGRRTQLGQQWAHSGDQLSQVGAHVTDRPTLTCGLLSQMRSQAPSALRPMPSSPQLHAWHLASQRLTWCLLH